MAQSSPRAAPTTLLSARHDIYKMQYDKEPGSGNGAIRFAHLVAILGARADPTSSEEARTLIADPSSTALLQRCFDALRDDCEQKVTEQRGAGNVLADVLRSDGSRSEGEIRRWFAQILLAFVGVFSERKKPRDALLTMACDLCEADGAVLFADAATGTLDAGRFIDIARRCSDGPDYTSMQLAMSMAARLFAARSERPETSAAVGDSGAASASLLEAISFANEQLRRSLDALGLPAAYGETRSTSPSSPLGGGASSTRTKAMTECDHARAVTHALLPLLKDPFCRAELIASADGIPQLTRVVANYKALAAAGAGATQLLYEAAAALWLLSYSPRSFPAIIAEKTLAALVEMSKGTDSNKLVRVTLLAMVNLLGAKVSQPAGEIAMNELMIEAGAMGLLEELPLRHWQNYDDDDVARDIKMVHTALKIDFRFFSSFERYKRELEKGVLKKGPLHTVDFWKENWSRFDTDSFGLIRKLVQIIQMTPASPIQTAEDCEKLSVACFDVGEFARLYPTGKSIIKDLNGLAVVMELIRCTNEEVSKAALLCSSKIMIAKWQFVELTK